jgi:hypothetical protein
LGKVEAAPVNTYKSNNDGAPIILGQESIYGHSADRKLFSKAGDGMKSGKSSNEKGGEMAKAAKTGKARADKASKAPKSTQSIKAGKSSKAAKSTVCDPETDVVLSDYQQWEDETGYWIGEYSFYQGDGTPYVSTSWPYPYESYKGYITGNVSG